MAKKDKGKDLKKQPKPADITMPLKDKTVPKRDISYPPSNPEKR